MTKITIDNKFVVDGNKVYEIYHTHGLPLSLALDTLNKLNSVCDWEGYFTTALNDGMIIENEYRRACEAVVECYGDEYFTEWNKRVRMLLIRILKETSNV